MQRSYGPGTIIQKYRKMFNLNNGFTKIYPIGNGDLSGFWEKPTAFSVALPSRCWPLQEDGAQYLFQIPLPALSPPLSLLKLKDLRKRLPSLLRLEKHHDRHPD